MHAVNVSYICSLTTVHKLLVAGFVHCDSASAALIVQLRQSHNVLIVTALIVLYFSV